MRKGSIALNLFAFSLVWLVIALALTAFLLSNLYSRSLDDSLRETLEFHLETLVGATLVANGELIPSSSIADPRFSRPASGWYWEVSDENSKIIKFSPSLVGSVLPKLDIKFDAQNMRSQVIVDSFDTKVRVVERKISFNDFTFFVRVSGNLDEIEEQVKSFRGQALIVLGAVGVMLAIMSGFVGRFALRPIGRISAAIEAIREGEATKVEGSYPKEIAPLAEEVNELIHSNRQVVERARSQVGNLAHGLKTPLSVLRNETLNDKTNLGDIVRIETEKMNEQVATYLKRAQMSARSSVIGQKTDVKEVLERLVRVMKKLNPKIELEFIVQENVAIFFKGEKNDLEEMSGNLIDNACKWAKSKVEISLELDKSNDAVFERLKLTIEDDGTGLSPKEMKMVLRRGVRIDEKTPGSGLGLDIVKELVDIYGGSLNLLSSKMGGLKIELILPVVKIKTKIRN